MTKVKHFQVKPEHVEAMQFGGKNGNDIVEWVSLFADRYNIKVTNHGTHITITNNENALMWQASRGDWVVRSFLNQYFYVEPDAVMADQYIKL
jgi:hypothetical protein